jgi:hypothetical protein
MIPTGAVFLALALGSQPGDESAAAIELGAARKTKVLYAGVLDTPRARAFVEFLRQSFEQVGELDVTKLSMQTAAPYDVVIADGRRLYPMDPEEGLDLPQVNLGPEFTRPIVMLTAIGGSVQHHTKIEWL